MPENHIVQAINRIPECFTDIHLFEALGDGVLTLQGKQIIQANPAAAALLGRSTAELAGLSLIDLCPPQQPDGAPSTSITQTRLKTALEGQPQRFEWQFLRPDGAPVDVEIILIRSDQYGKALLSCILRDRSILRETENTLREARLSLDAQAQEIQRLALARQRMEKTYQENREIYSLAIGAANLGIYDTMVKDEDLTLQENWLARLGYNPREANESNLTWESLIHPDDYERVISLFQKALNGEIDAFNIEYRLKTRAGDWRWIYESSKVIEKSSGGNPPRIVGTHLDITHRKLSEVAEREQRAFAEALSDTAAVLNSTLDIDKVLDLILTNVGRVVPHDGSDIWLTDPSGQTAYPAQRKAIDGSFFPLSPTGLPIEEIHIFAQMARTRKPVLLTEVQRELEWISIEGRRVSSCLGTPITFGDKLLGFLVLISAEPNYFTRVHIERLQAFANQAAVAIRNAQLYTRAQEVAALEERQRLAREMHDVISQTLFSATIKAEALPYLVDIDRPEEVKKNLYELHRLTRGALAEMRTLLMELRPNTIVNTQMSNLLKQLADGLSGRSTIDISVSAEGHGLLPPDVQTAFFRIAQEAINNLVKHSHACHVDITYANYKDRVILSIQDDGCGFDPASLPPDRMGVRIMRERAEAVHADLNITSQPGQGTLLLVEWYNPPK